MGYSGLARWVNADAESLAKVEHNIHVNHDGRCVGRWALSLKSYRSTFGLNPTQPNVGPSTHNNERVMITIQNHDVVFVLLEDQMAPTHSNAAALGLQEPLTHYRNHLITVRPPGALENLLVMLKARWMPVRHAAGTVQNAGTISMGAGTGLGMGPTGGGGVGKGGAGAPQNNPFAAAELTVEGKIWAIGPDWYVRIGLVKSKDTLKGMLLEAEYRPITVQQLHDGFQLDNIVSAMLESILPVTMEGASIYAVNVGQGQWDDILWDREEVRKRKEKEMAEAEKKAKREEKKDGDANAGDGEQPPEDDDDVYVYGMDDDPHVPSRDWAGIDRERRSAYMVSGVLKQENLL